MIKFIEDKLRKYFKLRKVYYKIFIIVLKISSFDSNQ